jgi:hypothetical protein
MAPKGGARQPTKVIATNATNPDDILTFDSLTAAAKGVNAPGHNTIKRLLKTGEVYNGYRLSMLEPPPTVLEATTSATPAAPAGGSSAEHKHNEFTFFEEVDDLFKGQKVRYTKEQPVQVSVFDVIRVMTGNSNPRPAWGNIQLHYAEVVQWITTYQFSGSGERPTPVCSVQTLIELINLLPGERAARFRQAGAKVLVRVLGGDETLVDEIRENAVRMEQIAVAASAEDAEPHPINAFQLPGGLTGANAVCSLMLSPGMHGKTVADIRGTCTYLILFKHNDQVGIKFGWTKNLQRRVKDHNRLYPDMKVWAAFECHNHDCAEAAEQLFKGKMAAYLDQVKLGDKLLTEVLTRVTPEEAERQMQAALDTVVTETSSQNQVAMKELELRALQLQLDLKRQDVELEKTRAANHQAENERLRLLIEMHQLGIHHPPLGPVAMRPSPPLG